MLLFVGALLIALSTSLERVEVASPNPARNHFRVRWNTICAAIGGLFLVGSQELLEHHRSAAVAAAAAVKVVADVLAEPPGGREKQGEEAERRCLLVYSAWIGSREKASELMRTEIGKAISGAAPSEPSPADAR